MFTVWVKWKKPLGSVSIVEGLLHKDLTAQILETFYKVYRALGYGFLEKVYENALVLELRNQGLQVEQQVPIKVYYRGHIVGEYVADVVVEQKVLVEIKAVEHLAEAHRAQLLNYLHGTPLEVGLLLNFGPRPQVVRRILTNDRKPWLSRPKNNTFP